MTGTVLRGSYNIFTILPDDGGGPVECRFKGKVLKDGEGFYNPLAPGDRVNFESDGKGSFSITGLKPRRNLFTRLNQKGFNAKRSAGGYGAASAAGVQIIAANIDMIFCTVSPASPPFRPRFIDRVLAGADYANIPAVILVNKWDLFDAAGDAGDDDTGCGEAGRVSAAERIDNFIRAGYRVLKVSAKTGEGLGELKELVAGRLTALVGQSGVGKSSVISALSPDLALRTGAVNEKYDRGNHTTTQAALWNVPGAGMVIDTPGIRRFVPDVPPGELVFHFKEFAEPALKCAFGLSCTHTNEPGCGVLAAVESGGIHLDRYESFLRLRGELAELKGNK